MDRYRTPTPRNGDAAVTSVPYRGAALLRHPMFNKGTAFTHQERALFGLEGLLPAAVNTIDQQSWRAYGNLMRKADPLERYVGLMALQDRNEHLFYRLLLDHPEELLPLVYGPVLGRVCREFSHVFRRGRGLWITPEHRGRIDAILRNSPFEDVRLVVATDNEGLIGLGDQGAGGMVVAIGKLVLYTVAAGVHPTRTLPVSLDVGTDNASLLDDELYLGWRYPRLRGVEYESLVDEFVRAVKRRFPEAMVAWEGLPATEAFRLLDRYQRVLPCFNDEAQSAAALALAAILAAERLTGARLAKERFVVLGTGPTGVGLARLLRHALRSAGLGLRELRRAVAVVDEQGLVVAGRPGGDSYRREVAWPEELAAGEGLLGGPRSLAEVVAALRPTVLIDTVGGARSGWAAALRTMASAAEHPIVVSLVGERAEAEPGLPMPANIIEVRPASPALIFPGLGLAGVVGRVREVTDGMFLAAARALADAASEEDLRGGRLLPGVRDLRRAAAAVAQAVLREAREAGVGLPFQDRDLSEIVGQAMWIPAYPRLSPLEPLPDEHVPAAALPSVPRYAS